MKTIDIFACIDCPWCAVTHFTLRRLQQESPELFTAVTFNWQPFILKYDIPQEGEKWEDPDILNYVNSDAIKDAMQKAGLDMKYRTHRYDTTRASILAMYAKEQKEIEGFLDACYEQYFCADKEEDKNLYDLRILQTVADRSLSKKVNVKDIIKDTYFIKQLQQALSLSQKLGINSVPTLILDQKILFSGYLNAAKVRVLLTQLSS